MPAVVTTRVAASHLRRGDRVYYGDFFVGTVDRSEPRNERLRMVVGNDWYLNFNYDVRPAQLPALGGRAVGSDATEIPPATLVTADIRTRNA